MHVNYKTQGTCSTAINFDLDDGIINNVVFTDGCDGNLKAIPRLINGLKAKDVADKLRGNTCGFKNTSCADQLARAIDQHL
jgi:uncharacterized protein (TIGR03905 family)